MTNRKYIFSLMLTALIVISFSSAATVTNSIHKVSLTPSQTDIFQFTFTPDKASEIGVPMKVSMDDGDCSKWVSVDVKSFELSTKGTRITATTKVPSDVVNGNYVCSVVATAPAQGMVSMAIGVPLKINITGGKEPTPAPTTVPELPSDKVTAQETSTKAVSLPVSTITTEQTTQAPNQAGKPEGIPTNTIAAAIAGLLLMSLVIVGAYDYRRGKR